VFRAGELDRADWRFLKTGPVQLFRSDEVLDQALRDLGELEYLPLRWNLESDDGFRRAVSKQLKWQAQFGYVDWTGNLDALNDGLRAEPFGSSDRSVIVLENFDRLRERDSLYAFKLLDVLAMASWHYMLFGKALLCFVHTNDPDLETPKLAGRAASWNDKERRRF
jgi:hypothetical protein